MPLFLFRLKVVYILKIKILTGCTGVDFDGRDFSFDQGSEQTVKKDLGEDLIQAGHAEEIKGKPSTKKSDDK
jgi:hypothetical protein